MCKQIILLVAIALSGVNFINAGFHVGEYYFSAPTVSDWFEANRYCTFHGMYLVDIPYFEEYERILKMIQQVKLNTTLGDIWTSGNRLWQQPAHYWSTTGQPMLFSDFPPGEPTLGDEQCILLWAWTDYKFGDNLCTNKHNFVCRDTKIPYAMRDDSMNVISQARISNR